MKRSEIISSKEYWLSKIQIELFNQVYNYLEVNNLKKSDLAEKLGVSRSYISQVMNGDSDHRISKLVQISLAIGKVPDIKFKDLTKYIHMDENAKSLKELELMEALELIKQHGYMFYKARSLNKVNNNGINENTKSFKNIEIIEAFELMKERVVNKRELNKGDKNLEDVKSYSYNENSLNKSA